MSAAQSTSDASSDETLLARYRAGHPAAFEVL